MRKERRRYSKSCLHRGSLQQTKKVSFSLEVACDLDCFNQSRPSNLTNAFNSWYSCSELEEFKKGAKYEANKFRELSSDAVSSSATMSSLVLPFKNCGVYKKMKYLVKLQAIINDDKDTKGCNTSSKDQNTNTLQPEFRGLENRIFVERQRNKTIAITAVMEYQHRTLVLIEEAKNNRKSDSEISFMKQQFNDRLSTICSQLSQWSLDEALAAAHYDAEGVYILPTNLPNSENENGAKAETKAKRIENEAFRSRIKSTKRSSSKRKLEFVSNSDISMWLEQEQVKQARVSPICVSSIYNFG